MQRYRGTYAKINLTNIKENVSKIITKNNMYKYYFGVVKADSYGHYDNKVVKAIIEGGVNYLCVSSLEEALKIRQKFEKIPILCLGVIEPQYVSLCIKENISITVVSYEYLNSILKLSINKENLRNLKIHIKLDTGMNRLGIKEVKELKSTFDNINKNNLFIEGIYTHICNASNEKYTKMQFDRFDNLLKSIDISNVKIIHLPNSETLINYPKLKYVNGCRLGIVMYGFTKDKNLNLKSTFSVFSKIIQIKHIKKNESVGYDSIYKAKEDEIIGIVQIGYADGILRKNTGRNVYINNKEYEIIGNICMDMLMVRVDKEVKLYDEVVILKDIEHIEKVSKYLDTIPYEVMCNITKRVQRVYEK